MYISKLSLVNYRNFSNSKLVFSKGVNTIIGENASGKSNVFRAIRLLLDSSMSRSANRLSEGDICRDLPNWRGHWVIISITFDDISDDEVSQSLFVHGVGKNGEGPVTQATANLIFRPKPHIRQELAKIAIFSSETLDAFLDTVTIDDYETVLTGKSNADFNSEKVYKQIVGDFENVIFPDQVSQELIGVPLSRFLNIPNEVSFTFVKALRDVVSDFRNNGTNPLLKLLKKRSGEINQAEFAPVATAVKALNNQIEGLGDVKTVRHDIIKTIDASVGDNYSPHSLSIKSALSGEADELFQSLKLFIDESNNGYEGSIHEMSLGGANLIYLTLKLLEFTYQQEHESIGDFLLIEEPEAHIHTHIQKTLFDKINYSDTQIIYSTHSSHISEVCKIRSVNVIGKVGGKCEVFQPSVGLTNPQIAYVERYLDAIRSNLLFAKSVILVEGDAEEILIPMIIKKAFGLSLDELGISLVNIRSTGFENIALLFHDERIRKKCSIITDSDSRFYNTDPVEGDSEATRKRKVKAIGSESSGVLRKSALNTLCHNNQWLQPYYADHTFEVDFIKAGNQPALLSIVGEVYRDETTRAKSVEELKSRDIAVSGLRALAMAEYKKKGWFALTLAEKIEIDVFVPQYIMNAILFAHGAVQRTTLEKIIEYRFKAIKKYVSHHRDRLANLDPFSAQDENTQQWIDHLDSLDHGVDRFGPKWVQYRQSNEPDITIMKQAFIEDIPLYSSHILHSL